MAKKLKKGGMLNYNETEQLIFAQKIKDAASVSAAKAKDLARSWNFMKDEHGEDYEAAAIEVAKAINEEREEHKTNPVLVKVCDAINNGKLKILRAGSKKYGKLTLNITELVWARNFEDGWEISVYDEKNNHLGDIDYNASNNYKAAVRVTFAEGGGVNNQFIIVSSYWGNKKDEMRSEKMFADYIKNNPINNVWIGFKKIDNFKFDMDSGRMIMRYALRKGANLKYYVSFLNHSVALKNNNAVFLQDRNYEDFDNKILTKETLELLKTETFAKGGGVDNRIPIYGVFGSYIQDKQGFAPFLKDQPKWTSSLTEATKIYNSITLKDFQQDTLKERKDDAIGDVSFDGFLLVELNYCIINNDYFNNSNKEYHAILEHVDYNIELEKERGISLTGKKLSKEEMEDNLYASGGGVAAKPSPRFMNSPALRYANFDDGSFINLLRLQEWKTTGKYKDPYKYVIYLGITSVDLNKRHFKFKTLSDAEHRFNELVEERKATVKLRNEGVVERNYKEGGSVSNEAIESLQALADICEGAEKQEYLDAIEAMKTLDTHTTKTDKQLREEQLELLVQELSEDLKPTVVDIEKKFATTKDHYGNYASVISTLSKNKAEAHIIAKALIRAGANRSGVSSALQVMYGYEQGGSLPSTAKVIVISSKNPLYSQFAKMGVAEDTCIYKDSEPHVHKTNIGYIVSFTANYFSQVDKHVINDNLSFVKFRFPEITDFEWVNAPKFEDGGDIHTQYEYEKTKPAYDHLSDYLNYQPHKSLILKDYPQSYPVLSEEFNNEIINELGDNPSNDEFDKLLAEKIDNTETSVLVRLLIDELMEEFSEPVIPKQKSESDDNQFEKGGMLSKLGLSTTSEFGNKHRDWLLKTAKKHELGEYVGYRFDMRNQTFELIGKNASSFFTVKDGEFPQNMELTKQSTIHYKKGGSLSELAAESVSGNNYENLTAEHVWNAWTINQRRHFLYDHYQRNNQKLDTYQNLFGSVEKPYAELEFDIQMLVYNHILDGSYADGGTMEHGESGLIVTALSKEDSEKLKRFVETSDYYADHNIVENYFFFPEEADTIDTLETELSVKFNEACINAKFERADNMNCGCGCKLAYGGKLNRGERPSPQYSATLFEQGYQMQGQDGNDYHIVKDKRGVQRWQKVKYASGGELRSGQYATLKTPYKGYSRVQLMEYQDFKWLVKIEDSGLEISVYADELAVDSKYYGGGSIEYFVGDDVILDHPIHGKHKGTVVKVMKGGWRPDYEIRTNDFIVNAPPYLLTPASQYEEGGNLNVKSKIMTPNAYLIINHWVYFTLNYPPDFMNAFGSKGEIHREHLQQKFDNDYEEKGSRAVMNSFYSKLDSANTNKLTNWALRNYQPINVPDAEYADVVKKWVYFGYGYHTNFLDIFPMKQHLSDKFNRIYKNYGSNAVMNLFWTELDKTNSLLLSDYVAALNNYLKGGSTQSQYIVMFYLSETDMFTTPKECMALYDDPQAIFSDYPLAIIKEITAISQSQLQTYYDQQQTNAYPYRIFKYLGSDNERCVPLKEGTFYKANYSDDKKYIIIYTHPLGYMSFDAKYFSEIPESYKIQDLTDDDVPFEPLTGFAKGGNISLNSNFYANMAERSRKITE